MGWLLLLAIGKQAAVVISVHGRVPIIGFVLFTMVQSGCHPGKETSHHGAYLLDEENLGSVWKNPPPNEYTDIQ